MSSGRRRRLPSQFLRYGAGYICELRIISDGSATILWCLVCLWWLFLMLISAKSWLNSFNFLHTLSVSELPRSLTVCWLLVSSLLGQQIWQMLGDKAKATSVKCRSSSCVSSCVMPHHSLSSSYRIVQNSDSNPLLQGKVHIKVWSRSQCRATILEVMQRHRPVTMLIRIITELAMGSIWPDLTALSKRR